VKHKLKRDAINHPAHYNQGKIEVIEALEDWSLGLHEANAVKYIARARHKGNEIQDLEKAVWYLRRKIELLEGAAEDRIVTRPNDMRRASK
jgi:hypothetical protein